MTKKCVLCGGLGWLMRDTLGRAGYMIASGTVECPACEGVGQVADTTWGAYKALCDRTAIEIPMFIGSN